MLRPRFRAVLTVLVGTCASAAVCLAPVPAGAMAAGASVAQRSTGPTIRTTTSVPTFTETWSTGPLADAGSPIAESSPTPVTLDGQPSVVVGDRGDNLYAYELAAPGPADPPAVPAPVVPTGWTGVHANAPIDSTPSVVPAAAGGPAILVGSGDDASPSGGGYQAYGPDGSLLWVTSVQNPSTDGVPDGGVSAGISIGTLQAATTGTPSAVAGSLGQVAYALDPATGTALPGWPFLNTDSTHATAAQADLYGTGRDEVVEASDQSAGLANGQTYHDGGDLRILSGTGNQVCRATTDQVLDSSPAVGGFLAGGATGIVDGTGSYFAGASDTDMVKAFDTRCDLVWAVYLDGSTASSPALSDVLGNGSLQVVEATDTGPSSGSVYALDGATGKVLWQAAATDAVIGSVTTADLFGQGYDDVLVPTIDGLDIIDGRTGDLVTELDGPGNGDLGLQNAPLVTEDPNGTVGITLAGYIGPADQGRVDHFEIDASDGAAALADHPWPMFHHDPQLTGDAGGTPSVGSIGACSVPGAAFDGYDLVAADGGVSAFPSPSQPFCGSAGGAPLNKPVVSMAMAPSVGGYWLVASDGGIFAYGQAGFHGSMGGSHLNQPIVGMAATPDGGGYWLVASDGGIFAFGDAGYYGSMGGSHLNQPIVGMAATPDGAGYWLVASDGGIFAFGDARYEGSLGGQHLTRPVVGIARDPNSGGYWLVASDGGVFAFGGAPFLGSTGAIVLAAPVTGMEAAANGTGYRFAAGDGGVFSYVVPFLGSAASERLVAPVVGMAGY